MENITEQYKDKQPAEQAMRFNAGKIELSYILSADKAMSQLADVLTFGAQKYARDNWKKGMPDTKVMDSLMRHLVAYANGELYDPESGLPHTGHIMANAMFLAQQFKGVEDAGIQLPSEGRGDGTGEPDPRSEYELFVVSSGLPNSLHHSLT